MRPSSKANPGSEGYIIPPTEPGLGVELNEEYIQGFPYEGTQLHLEMGHSPWPRVPKAHPGGWPWNGSG